MSGYADSKLLSRGLNERTMKILRKPFTPDELKIRVGELIADVAAEGTPHRADSFPAMRPARFELATSASAGQHSGW